MKNERQNIRNTSLIDLSIHSACYTQDNTLKVINVVDLYEDELITSIKHLMKMESFLKNYGF